MPKFKVGDKVRIISHIGKTQHYFSIGVEATIAGGCREDRYDVRYSGADTTQPWSQTVNTIDLQLARPSSAMLGFSDLPDI